ncbi:hypothetical protein K7X08_037821 [Anisodus acutangulus]|uniref:Uncharacterized protein n=1 Tax=Anisodus acutangulus TaxID=402998 RepID=A0A9Q1MX78_9SOLA|nr:hypothetical protein K7X08_037821 [Anisodus acutangulus]
MASLRIKPSKRRRSPQPSLSPAKSMNAGDLGYCFRCYDCATDFTLFTPFEYCFDSIVLLFLDCYCVIWFHNVFQCSGYWFTVVFSLFPVRVISSRVRVQNVILSCSLVMIYSLYFLAHCNCFSEVVLSLFDCTLRLLCYHREGKISCSCILLCCCLSWLPLMVACWCYK